MSERTYWTQLRQRRINRRTMLGASAKAGVGAAGLALVGCGDDDDAAVAQVEEQAEQAQAQAQVQAEEQAEEQAAEEQAAEEQAEQAVEEEEAEEQAQAQAEEQATEAEEQAVAHVQTGEVRWPTSQNLSALEATVGTGGDDHQAFWAVHDNLVIYDANLSPDAEVSLAQSWEIPDPLNVIFSLREGVVYHDGAALTSETVRLHMERGKNLEVSRIKADLDAVENVVEVDTLTAHFEMSRPFSPLLLILGDRAGALTSPAAFERISEASSREAPVGTGAFQYVDEDLDGPYIMGAFADYWMPNAPSVEKLILSQGVIPSQQANGILTGEFDVILQTPPEDKPRLEDSSLAVALNPTNSSAHVWLNRNQEPWTNEHLRRAYFYALDRDRLVDVVRNGIGVPNKWGWLGPATGVYHNPDEILVEFNPERVRQELELGGAPDGFSFKANVLNTPADITRAEFHQANLAEFGIEMEIVGRPSPDYYLEFWDLAASTLIAGMSPRADIWQQMAFGHAADGPMDFSLPADKDPEVQDAFQKVAETFDPDDRVVAVQDLNRLVMEGAFIIPENFAVQTWAWDPDLQFEIYKDGKPHFGQNNVSWAT
jgi:peptide/nickel transport system substrate-binding protein